MILVDSIKTFGEYILLMKRVLSQPERWRVFFRRMLHEMYQLGVNSIPIVLLISFFIGAVICIQLKLNIESPWMPKMVVGYSTREILILEFSSSIMCLILAGKVGSNITSEIGTMRVTQQIDALEIMGVNSANFLILPKITALISMIPMLVIFSIAAGTAGAFAIGKFTGIMTPEDLMVGLQYEFQQWYIWCSIIKSVAFAFIITSVSSFYGYRVSGGSLEVGKASTNAVVSCSALILFADMVLTQLLMQ
ncbi:MAG: ABC transporter permease [Bacteroidaceae bacterium]|nr:ABC transporter permease [Bacteroidaceae bacterium]